MISPISTIIAELKKIGYDIYLEGERVRYKCLGLDPPKDQVAYLLKKIKTHKSEALAYLKDEEILPSKENLLSLSLSDFKTQNLAVRIRSKVLGEDVWLVSNETVRVHLKAEGLACYLPEEILRLEGLSPEGIRSVHEAKKIFKKSRLIETKQGRESVSD